MLSLFLAALALAPAVAQAGTPARYPCGTSSSGADQSVCDALTSTAGPIGSQCVQDSGTGDYFCGFQGATCVQSSQCDYGRCSSDDLVTEGQCLGGFGDSCVTSDGTNSDNLCLGNLFCLGPAGELGDGTCGGIGAECDVTGDYEYDASGNDQACASGSCDASTFMCVAAAAAAPGASQAARRERRHQLLARKGQVCAIGHSACQIDGLGYECVDTTSSLERCGGCGAQDGGVDCSTITGAVGVECVNAKCVVSSCSLGFMLDEATGACAPSPLNMA